MLAGMSPCPRTPSGIPLATKNRKFRGNTSVKPMYAAGAMERLNYHHLLYFWMVAREGSVAGAAARLRLAQPTLSGQIHALEDALGEKLFVRAGRGLRLTEMGRVVFGYAEEIFALGHELTEIVKGQPTGRALRLAVGVAHALPKFVAHRLLEPALALPQPVRLRVHVGSTEQLLARLALHELDVVLTDRVAPPGVSVRAFNHLLGDCAVTMFATPPHAARYRRGFPRSLNDAPFLLPGETSTLRRGLEQWFEQHGIRPRVVGEFDDSSLIEVFGQAGRGIFATPSIVAASVRRQYGVRAIGTLGAV